MDRREVIIAGAVLPLLGVARAAYAEGATVESTMAGALRRLTEAGQGDNRATYLPDGKMLLFASMRTGRSQIWSIEADGNRLRRFHDSGANDYGRVAPSRDGT